MDRNNFFSTLTDYEEISILRSDIAVGNIIKIRIKGDIKVDTEEEGYLFLQKGTKILPHKHIDDMETYKVIYGKVIINGEEANYNTCSLGEEHSIDKVLENTLIKYHKTKVLIKDKKTSENPKSYKKTC